MRGWLGDAVLVAGLLLLSASQSWPQQIEIDPVLYLGPQEELSPEYFEATDFRKYLEASVLYQKLGPPSGRLDQPDDITWMLAQSRLGDQPDFSVGIYTLNDYSKTPFVYKPIIMVREFSAPRGKPFEATLKKAPEKLEAGDTRLNDLTAENLKQSLDQINQVLNSLDVSSCQVPIEGATMRRIGSVWDAMLRRTRYDHNDNPDAGEGVHFASKPYLYRFYNRRSKFDAFNNVALAGVAGWADDHTKSGLMVSSALAMRDYCKTKDRKYLAVLNQKLDALEKRIPKEAPN